MAVFFISVLNYSFSPSKEAIIESEVLMVIIPPLALIFAVLGSILLGIATVNQAGSIGAIGATMMTGYSLHKG